MIEIEFVPGEYKLQFSGHAGYDEKGRDIVCAAVSILFYTLKQTLDDCSEMLLEYADDEDENESYIQCEPLPEYTANIELVYMTVLTGIELLSQEYPEYIKFTVIG